LVWRGAAKALKEWADAPRRSPSCTNGDASVGTEVDIDDKGASWKGISASFGGLLEFGH
jgi:hypothetical protein